MLRFQKLGVGGLHRQQGDPISLLLFFEKKRKEKEVTLKWKRNVGRGSY
jgi:hypothetical protein